MKSDAGPPNDTPRPWGRIAGILVACAVTLVGMAVQLDPDVILIRCLVASTIVAFTVRTIVGFAPSLNESS